MGKAKTRPKPKTQPTPAPKKIDLRKLRGETLIRVRRKKMDQFLELYGKYGTLTLACHEAGIREERIHDWRARDPIFAKQMDQAEKLVGDRLVKEVITRATVGEPKNIYNKLGEHVDTIFEKSDALTIFATKRFRPEFRDRVDIPAVNPTINIQNNTLIKIDPSKLEGPELDAYVRLLEQTASAAGLTDPGSAASPASVRSETGAAPAPIPPVR